MLGREALRIVDNLKTQIHTPEKEPSALKPTALVREETPKEGIFAGTIRLPAKNVSKAITRPREWIGRGEP